MATVQCSKCTAERKGFRRELDSWRHKLIHCVGFESILEGICGPMLLGDLKLHDGCQPEEVDDWIPASLTQCSFCNLPLDKVTAFMVHFCRGAKTAVKHGWGKTICCCRQTNLTFEQLFSGAQDQAPSSTSPLSSPSDYSPCQAPTISENHQSAHRFLQAVFHKKEAHLGCDSSIPLAAQELMKKMVHQFALEYASKCLLNTSTNGVTTRTSSPLPETADAPLDLTVSRTQEKEDTQSEPDAVLDLSNRNSGTSSTISSTQKASGCLLPLPAEELGKEEHRRHQTTALDTVLSSLCPSHRSLLHQIMKLAQQEQLLLFLNHRHAGRHCYCGVNTEESVAPNVAPVLECKAHSCCSYNLLNSFNGPGHGSTACPPLDSKPNGSIRLYHFTNSKAGAYQASGCCCLQTAGVEAYAVLCPKRLHIFPCPSLAVCNSNNLVCSLASPSNSASVCTVSSSLCPSLANCCKQQKLHAHHCCTSFFTVGEKTTEQEVRDADPPCPVLKREQSPSPPPLSPIPTDASKKCDEKPPSLFPHRQWEEDSSNPSHQEANMDIEKQPQDHHPPTSSHAEQNPSVTILQDVMNRFSEKLETIRPAEKDPPLDSTVVCVSENEPPPSPSTSQKAHFHGDAHLTEIITTVLHTGGASDYNLSELFHHQESKGPKSPNTRSRRRQEVLAAMATPHDASSRRHTLQIKRELALLDQSRTRRKVSLSKRAKSKDESFSVTLSNTYSDSDGPKQDTDMEMEPLKNDGNKDGSPKFSMAECGKDEIKEEIKAVVITEEVLDGKAEKEEIVSNEETKVAGVEHQIPGPEPRSTLENKSLKDGGFQAEPSATSKQPRKVGRPRKSALCHSAGTEGLNQESPSGPDGNNKSTPSQDGNSKDAGRTRRKIVPPQRFSSFVTESRKMYYVACFSENIFSKGAQKGMALYQEPDGEETRLKFTSAEHPPESAHEECGPSTRKASHSPSSSQNVSVQDKSPTKDSPEGTACFDRGAEVLGRLRSTYKRMQDVKITSETATNISDATESAASADSASNCQLHFTSPIKLMFVSPVNDEEGVRYSLKAAGPGCEGQAEEPFDPCEESSWSGTPRNTPKHDIQTAESAVSQMDSVSSPVKSATSPSPRPASPSRSVSPPFKARSSPPSRSSPLSPSKLSSSPAKHSPTALKSGPSPRKSPPSPAKSLRSASSSPKISPRRSGEGTPMKLVCDVMPLVESTPPKRRPGRPKKLKPQPEQKVKRPIGRPRKQKDADSGTGAKKSNGNADKPSDGEENANKNLKITVVYGRSRRNKRTVSEGFDQLQTEFRDACQAAGLKSDLGILTHNSNPGSVSMKSSVVEPPEILHFISPLKESTTQSSSNIKCQKRDDSAPIRKPGRPAKIKISGISVTVTTVSPRQRKIQMKKTNRLAPKMLIPAKVRSPESKAAKGPWTIHCKSAGNVGVADVGTEAKDPGKDRVEVRHSARVRKPSIHFLHAVATSAYRSYSRSNALLRRSKQLLLSKVSNERKQAEHAGSAEEKICGPRRQSIAEELGRVAGVSIDSIFSPKEALKWWAASAEERTMNQEFARRIRLISDTWVSDMVGNQEKEAALNSKLASKYERKTRAPSVVRALFDCSPNKPRSCSMQQLCSWFMKTTETRSLAIVKKASSRNPYEVMHFPRPGSNKSVCHSPQTERLRKHIKKFAKIVPKSPLEHRLMQRRARAEPRQSAHAFKRKLFTPEKRGSKWRSKKVLSKYQATLCRARTRFLNQRDRKTWQRQRSEKDVPDDVSDHSIGQPALGQNLKRQALRTSKHYRHLENHCTAGAVVERGHPVDVPKEQNLCCTAWSPERLKECRVFLRKINSPDSESAEEEWDSCTVTLDDGSPSADHVAGRRQELAEVVKAVKTERIASPSRASPRKRAGSAPGTAKERNEIPTRGRRGKSKTVPGAVSTEPPQPPPAKLLRQSRMRGLTGPRWCDFVLEN